MVLPGPHAVPRPDVIFAGRLAREHRAGLPGASDSQMSVRVFRLFASCGMSTRLISSVRGSSGERRVATAGYVQAGNSSRTRCGRAMNWKRMSLFAGDLARLLLRRQRVLAFASRHARSRPARERRRRGQEYQGSCASGEIWPSRSPGRRSSSAGSTPRTIRIRRRCRWPQAARWSLVCLQRLRILPPETFELPSASTGPAQPAVRRPGSARAGRRRPQSHWAKHRGLRACSSRDSVAV